MRVRSICLQIFVILCVALGAAAAPDVRAQAQAARVGLVFDVGGRGDLSFNDMAYAGLARATKTYAARIASKFLEPTAGGQNREELLRLLAEGKYDLIIGVGFLFTDAITRSRRNSRRPDSPSLTAAPIPRRRTSRACSSKSRRAPSWSAPWPACTPRPTRPALSG